MLEKKIFGTYIDSFKTQIYIRKSYYLYNLLYSVYFSAKNENRTTLHSENIRYTLAKESIFDEAKILWLRYWFVSIA